MRPSESMHQGRMEVSPSGLVYCTTLASKGSDRVSGRVISRSVTLSPSVRVPAGRMTTQSAVVRMTSSSWLRRMISACSSWEGPPVVGTTSAGELGRRRRTMAVYRFSGFSRSRTATWCQP